MPWKFCVFDFSSEMVKHHWFPEELESLVLDDVYQRHQSKPYQIRNKESLNLDPGGMVSLRSEPVVSAFGHYMVSVKPEHIYHVHQCWEDIREINPQVVKVYFQHECVVLPRSLHAEIGTWLASIVSHGIQARFDLFEMLPDNIIIDLPLIKNDNIES